MKFTGLDKLSEYISPAIRKVGDHEITLTGTRTQVLRIDKKSAEAWAGNKNKDVFGDADEKLRAALISNIIIKYPYNKVEIFGGKVLKKAATKTLNPEENLPIEFFIKMRGDHDTDPVAIFKDDILVDYFKDENNNVVPVYLQVTQLFGSMFGKNLVRKAGNLAPYRGKFGKPIENKIKYYLNALVRGLKL